MKKRRGWTIQFPGGLPFWIQGKQVQPTPVHYVPVHLGGRLFRNASMPSRKSRLM
jgi:hypothetical protein